MFYVKAKLKESPIHGIGLFADEDIPKGEKIYSNNPKLDLNISLEEFDSLSQDEKKTIQHYGYFDYKLNKWHLSFDNFKFCNHNQNNNMTRIENEVIAKKDIKKGEELTHDYLEFENPIKNYRNIKD